MVDERDDVEILTGLVEFRLNGVTRIRDLSKGASMRGTFEATTVTVRRCVSKIVTADAGMLTTGAVSMTGVYSKSKEASRPTLIEGLLRETLISKETMPVSAGTDGVRNMRVPLLDSRVDPASCTKLTMVG